MTSYTGITIGPLISTIEASRKTRELWASSYLFSYFIRQLVTAYTEAKDKANNPYFTVLSPHLETPHQKIGAGLYPDRIFIKHSTANGAEQLKITTEKVFKKLCEDIYSRIQLYKESKSITKSEVTEYLRSFFLLRSQTLPLPDNSNVIQMLTPYLDSQEESPGLPEIEKHRQILGLFLLTASLKNNKVKSPSFLFMDAFDVSQNFPSLIQISAVDLEAVDKKKFNKIIDQHFKAVNQGNTKEEHLLFQQLYQGFQNPDDSSDSQFLHYHRHIAIVHADGDNIGAVLKKIGTTAEGVKDFSKFLHTFAVAATKMIHNYGGTPIYIGGDDLFFLAPVARTHEASNSEGKPLDATILHLANSLDQLFQTTYRSFRKNQPLLENIPVPTLSFGINIEHTKSPLYEGIQHSREAMLFRAKNKELNPDKHTIALRLSTHSGSTQLLDISLKQKTLVTTCLNFIEKYRRVEVPFFNTFARKLLFLDPLFAHLIGDQEIDISRFLLEMTKHQDNESGEEDLSTENLCIAKDLTNLLHLVYATENQVKDPAKLIEFVIRFVHFLNRKIEL